MRVGVRPRREAGPCPAPCGVSPRAAAPTLVRAVAGQSDRTATPSQEREGGRHQTIHYAALPCTQLQAAIWGENTGEAGHYRRRYEGTGTVLKMSPRILIQNESPVESHGATLVLPEIWTSTAYPDKKTLPRVTPCMASGFCLPLSPDEVARNCEHKKQPCRIGGRPNPPLPCPSVGSCLFCSQSTGLGQA